RRPAPGRRAAVGLGGRRRRPVGGAGGAAAALRHTRRIAARTTGAAGARAAEHDVCGGPHGPATRRRIATAGGRAQSPLVAAVAAALKSPAATTLSLAGAR